MKRSLIALLTLTTLAAFPLAVPAASSAAPAGGCVTRAEYDGIREGMWRGSVERAFGTTRSRLADGAAGGYSRAYRACNGTREAVVEYAVVYKDGKPAGARFTGFKRWLRA